jgi:pimeloyl-ACP methyl ester carboxylesterase
VLTGNCAHLHDNIKNVALRKYFFNFDFPIQIERMPTIKKMHARRLYLARRFSKATSILKDSVLRTVLQTKPGAGRGPKLEVLSAGPRWSYKGAPIVFVHGAYGGAWMWNEHFLRYFARAGRRVHALSLRGHGRSEGRCNLNTTSFSDYIDDVRHLLARITVPPILVGHSLGGLIVQRLIDRVPICGIILMASAPPEGIFLVGKSPTALVDHLHRAIPGRTHQTDFWRRMLFSDELPVKRVTEYAARMVPESTRALSDAQIPNVIVSAVRANIPALVIAANHDRIIDRAMSRRTTHYHGAAFRKVEPSGHALMLDVSWEQAAKFIRQWLIEKDI